MKTCTDCNRELPKGEFPTVGTRLARNCRDCRDAHDREHAVPPRRGVLVLEAIDFPPAIRHRLREREGCLLWDVDEAPRYRHNRVEVRPQRIAYKQLHATEQPPKTRLFTSCGNKGCVRHVVAVSKGETAAMARELRKEQAIRDLDKENSKRCRKCGERKPLTAFQRSRGASEVCRACHRPPRVVKETQMRTLPAERDWEREAPCIGADMASENPDVARFAVEEYCTRCPFVRECDDLARSTPMASGVWGGRVWKNGFPMKGDA